MAITCALAFLTSCSVTGNETADVTAQPTETAPRETQTPVVTAEPTPEPYEPVRYEAEDAEGNALDEYATPDGGIAMGVFDKKRCSLTFTVNVPTSAVYELQFINAGEYGETYNTVTVNGRTLTDALHTTGNDYQTSAILAALNDGDNTIIVTREQGWIYIDCLIVLASDGITQETYDVSKQLSNANASENTKRLMSYLVDIYGNQTLAGQYESDFGVNSPEIQDLYELTGKHPAIVGFDLMDYSPSRVERGATGTQIPYVLDWADMGGIVTLIWHWNAPKGLIDTKEDPWWDGYNTSATTFDLGAALDGSDPDGYDLLIRDMDVIAEQLKILADKDIPVLWRPLHEASGGWFWWGASGAENYKALWKLMYDRYTNVHHLNNLIWVYNGQAGDWYPGDEYVDIIAEDVYTEPYDYESQYNLFYQATGYTRAHKLIGLAENGVIPDPDLMYADNARWLFFITWSDLFVVNQRNQRISDEYNELSHFISVYDSEKIVTLDELPDLTAYPTEQTH